MSYYNSYMDQANQPPYNTVGAPLYHVSNVPQQPVNMMPNTRYPQPVQVLPNTFSHGSVEHTLLSNLSFHQQTVQQPPLIKATPLQYPLPAMSVPSQAQPVHVAPQGHNLSQAVPIISPAHLSQAVPIVSPTQTQPTELTSMLTPPTPSLRSRAIPIIAPDNVRRSKSSTEMTYTASTQRGVSKAAPPVASDNVQTYGQYSPDIATVTSSSSWVSKAIPIIPPYDITGSKPSSDSTEQQVKTDTEKTIKSPTDAIYDKFIGIIEEHGPQKPNSDLILGQFIALPSESRKIVMTKGSVRNFLLQSDRVELKGDLLYITEMATESFEEENDDVVDEELETLYDMRSTLTTSAEKTRPQPLIDSSNVKDAKVSSVIAFEKVMLKYGVQVKTCSTGSKANLEVQTASSSTAPVQTAEPAGFGFNMKNPTVGLKQSPGEHTTVKCSLQDDSSHSSDTGSDSPVDTTLENELDYDNELLSEADISALEEQLENLATSLANNVLVKTIPDGKWTNEEDGDSEAIEEECYSENLESGSVCSSPESWNNSLQTGSSSNWSSGCSRSEGTPGEDLGGAIDTSPLMTTSNTLVVEENLLLKHVQSPYSVRTSGFMGERLPKDMEVVQSSRKESIDSLQASRQNMERSTSQSIGSRDAIRLPLTNQTETTKPSPVLYKVASTAAWSYHQTMKDIPPSGTHHNNSSVPSQSGPALNYPVRDPSRLGLTRENNVTQSLPRSSYSHHQILTNQQVVVRPSQITLSVNGSLNVGAHEFIPRSSVTAPIAFVHTCPVCPSNNSIIQQTVRPQHLYISTPSHMKQRPQSTLSAVSPEFKPGGFAYTVPLPPFSSSSSFSAPPPSVLTPPPSVCNQGTTTMPTISPKFKPGCFAYTVPHPPFSSSISSFSAPPPSVLTPPPSMCNQGTTTMPTISPKFKPEGFAYTVPGPPFSSSISSFSAPPPSVLTPPPSVCNQSTTTMPTMTRDRGTATPRRESRDLGVQSEPSTLNVAEVCINTTESMFDPDSMHHIPPQVETKEKAVGTKHMGDSVDRSTQTGCRGNTFMQDFKCQTELLVNIPQNNTGDECYNPILENQYQALLQQMMVTLLQTNPAMMSDPKLLKRTAYQHLMTMLGKGQSAPATTNVAANNAPSTGLMQPDFMGASAGLFNPFMGMPMMPSCMPMFGMAPMLHNALNDAQSFISEDNSDLPAGKKLKNVMPDSEPDPPEVKEPTPTKKPVKKTRSKKKSCKAKDPVQSPPTENFKPVMDTDKGFHFTERETVTFIGDVGALNHPPKSGRQEPATVKSTKTKSLKKKNKKAAASVSSSSLTSLTSSSLESAESRPETPDNQCQQQHYQSSAAGVNTNNSNASAEPKVSSRHIRLGDSVPESWEDEVDIFPVEYKIKNMVVTEIKLPDQSVGSSSYQTCSEFPGTTSTSSLCSSPVDSLPCHEFKTKQPHSATSVTSVSQLGHSLDQVKLSLDFTPGKMDTLDELLKSRRKVRLQRSTSSSPEVQDFMPGYLKRPGTPTSTPLSRNDSKSFISRPPGISVQKPTHVPQPKPTNTPSTWFPKGAWRKLDDKAGSDRSQSKTPPNDTTKSAFKAPHPIPSLMNLDVPHKEGGNMCTLKKNTKSQEGFTSISKDSTKVSELCTIDVGEGQPIDAWQQVATKKKRGREASNPVSTVPAHLIGRKMVSLVGQAEEQEKKATNFDRVIQRMKEKFPRLERTQLLGLMNEVRSKRGTLKGVAMEMIISDAESIMASKKATASVPSPPNFNHNSASDHIVSPNKITLCAAVRKGKVCHQKSKCVFAHSAAEVDQNKAMMYMASAKSSKTPDTKYSDAVSNMDLVGEQDFDFVKSDEEPESNECLICRNHIRMSYGTKLDCGHEFHEKCIKSWIGRERTCPLCRKLTLLKDEFPTLGS